MLTESLAVLADEHLAPQPGAGTFIPGCSAALERNAPPFSRCFSAIRIHRAPRSLSFTKTPSYLHISSHRSTPASSFSARHKGCERTEINTYASPHKTLCNTSTAPNRLNPSGRGSAPHQALLTPRRPGTARAPRWGSRTPTGDAPPASPLRPTPHRTRTAPPRTVPSRRPPPPYPALPRRAAACAPPRPEPGGGRWVPGAAAAQRGSGPAGHAGTRSPAARSPQHRRPQPPGIRMPALSGEGRRNPRPDGGYRPSPLARCHESAGGMTRDHLDAFPLFFSFVLTI